MELEILGAHNCESAEARLTSLLIDGVLALDAGGLTSTLSLSAQRGLKAVLLTHHHFDHVRDLATLGMNLYGWGSIELYAPESALGVVGSYIFSDELYIDFSRRPSPRPTFKMCPLEPYKEAMIHGYAVLPLPVNHSVPTVGYQITSGDDKCLFYTGDTGRNHPSLWQAVSPQLLVTEVTMPNSYEEMATSAGHLTPGLLREELLELRRAKGYLPRIVIVHMNPQLEGEIGREVEGVATELGAEITLGYEGMRINL